jgi:hypothetical protein
MKVSSFNYVSNLFIFHLHEVDHHKRLLRLSGLSDRDRGTAPSRSPTANTSVIVGAVEICWEKLAIVNWRSVGMLANVCEVSVCHQIKAKISFFLSIA